MGSLYVRGYELYPVSRWLTIYDYIQGKPRDGICYQRTPHCNTISENTLRSYLEYLFKNDNSNVQYYRRCANWIVETPRYLTEEEGLLMGAKFIPLREWGKSEKTRLPTSPFYRRHYTVLTRMRQPRLFLLIRTSPENIPGSLLLRVLFHHNSFTSKSNSILDVQLHVKGGTWIFLP